MSQIRRKRERPDEKEHVDTMGSNVFSAIDNQSMHKSLNGEFILYQILLQQILDGKDTFNLKDSSLLNYFEPSDKVDQETMTEFDTSFKSDKAIHWYTRESCIYRILNKALRTQDIDDIALFTKMIDALNAQLSVEHQAFIKKQKTPSINVYRGQLISKDEVNRLKFSQGQFISMNSFLSTSTNRKKALEFATSRPPPNDKLTTILLEINVNFSSLTRPYADIKDLSAFSEEEEILFMFGCVFRIDQIEYDENLKLWMASLSLCDRNDPDMKQFSSSLDKELSGQNQLISLGDYFIHMLKYEEAEEHYQKILDQHLISDEIELAYCHQGLAKVKRKKGNYQLAIDHLNQALDYLKNSSRKTDHPLISISYNDLGTNYSELSDYLPAFQSYEKALETENNIPYNTYFGLAKIHFKLKDYHLALEYLQKSLQNQPETAHSYKAKSFIFMGRVYAAMNRKDDASQMFNKAIECQLKGLDPDHPDIGYTYLALGSMYSDINDQNKALEYIEKAHQLQLQSLPHNHPDFAQTYKSVGDIYMKMGDLEQALFYYHKTLENQLKTLLPSHISVAKTYLSLGHCYWKKKDYDQAVIHFHKVLDSELERERFGCASLSEANKTIGDLYLEKNDLDQALAFYLQALDNELKSKLNEDFSLVEIYRTIADLYYKKQTLNEALLYYNRLLDCHLRKSSVDESAIAETYSFIGKVYTSKVRYNETLLYYEPMQENKSSPNTYQDVDNIHLEKRHLDQALNYFTEYLQEQLKSLPKSDPSIGDCYQILANICYEKRNLDDVLKYSLQLLDNRLAGKRIDDPSLSSTYEAIGTTYFKKNQYNQALIYLNRLVDCQHTQKGFEDPLIIKTYKMIGKVYLKKNPLDQPSNYLDKLIGTQSVRKHSGSKTKKRSHSNITDFQFEKRHLNLAFAFFQRSLNHPIYSPTSRFLSLHQIYSIIGALFLESQDLNPALFYFQQSLFHQNNKHPRGNSSVAETNLIIGDIFNAQGARDKALGYYRQALYISEAIHPSNEDLIPKIKCKLADIILPFI